MRQAHFTAPPLPAYTAVVRRIRQKRRLHHVRGHGRKATFSPSRQTPVMGCRRLRRPYRHGGWSCRLFLCLARYQASSGSRRVSFCHLLANFRRILAIFRASSYLGQVSQFATQRMAAANMVAATSNIPVKAQPSAAGTSRKRAAPYLKLQGLPHSLQAF